MIPLHLHLASFASGDLLSTWPLLAIKHLTVEFSNTKPFDIFVLRYGASKLFHLQATLEFWNYPRCWNKCNPGVGGWDHPWKCLAYYEALHSILAVLPDRGAYGTRPQPPAHIGVNSRRCGHPWFRAFFIACFFHPIGTSQFGASNVKYDKMPNKISELLLAQGGKKYIFSAHWVFGDLKHFLQL